MNIDYDTVKDLAGAVKAGLLAAFGGVVGYATDVVHRGKPFSWLQYAVFVFVAFFIGQVLDSWLPLSLPGRGGVLMVAGTSAYPILVTLQSKVADLVNRLH